MVKHISGQFARKVYKGGQFRYLCGEDDPSDNWLEDNYKGSY